MQDRVKLSGIITVPFHIGDFLSGTMHMDTLEKGAYAMLLFSHYQIGEDGLPDNDKQLSRIAGVTLKTWQRIRPVLQQKFIVENGFWTHSKAIDTLRKVHVNSSAQRAKALKLHRPIQAAAEPQHCQPKPKPKPIDNTNVLSLEQSQFFDEFWRLYPKQRAGSKEKALQAFTKALTRSTAQEIISGTIEYAKSDEVAGGYAKGAAAWLNDDRWKNDYSATANRRNQGTRVRQERGDVDSIAYAAEQAKKMLSE